MKIRDWRYSKEGMSVHLECECGAIQCILLTNQHVNQIVEKCHNCGKEEAILLKAEPVLMWATTAAMVEILQICKTARLANVA